MTHLTSQTELSHEAKTEMQPSKVMPNGLTLRPYQQKVVDHMLAIAEKYNDVQTTEMYMKGIILANVMGGGKTFTTTSSAYELAMAKQITRICILAPKTMQDYWKREVSGMCLEKLVKVDIGTHTGGLTKLQSSLAWMRRKGEKVLFVVDEAHNFRTHISNNKPIKKKRQNDDDEPCEKKESTSRSKMMLNVAKEARFVMLLTGTPIVNYIEDLRNLMCALRGINDMDVANVEYPELKSSVGTRPSLEDMYTLALKKQYAGAFFVFTEEDMAAQRDIECDMPRCVQHVERITMSTEYLAWYEKIERNQEYIGIRAKDNLTFIHGIRRAVNGNPNDKMICWGPKIQRLQELLIKWYQENKDTKIIIYSAWLEFGVDMVTDVITKLGQPYVIIDGRSSENERRSGISLYNSGVVNTLIFTSAGSEGMDLKNTDYVVILEPHWNIARVKQAVARAVRIGSHSTHRNKEDPVVNVYHFVLQKKEHNPKEDPSADDKLLAITEEKEEWFKSCFIPFARRVSICYNCEQAIIPAKD